MNKNYYILFIKCIRGDLISIMSIIYRPYHQNPGISGNKNTTHSTKFEDFVDNWSNI